MLVGKFQVIWGHLVLAIGSKVHGFKASNGFLRAIKICGTPSFRGEVEPEACCKILWHVEKSPRKYEQKYFARPNPLVPSPVLSACYQMTASRIARGLWQMSQEFSFVIIIPPWFFMFIYHLGC
jgi:hypothetical protein